MGKKQHVVPHPDGWVILGEDNGRVTKIFQTKQEAIDTAREVVREDGGELLIYRRDGKLLQWGSPGGRGRLS